MEITINDIKEYRKNAIDILKKNSQYATAKAVGIAFDALVCIDQYKWERDVAIGQLEELGIGFGQKINGIYLSEKEYEELLEYKWKYEELCS